MPVKLIRVGKPAKLHRIVLGAKTFDAIGKVASASIVTNIQRGQQEDGTSIKENASETKDAKRSRKYKGSTRSLIDKKHRFIQPGKGSWTWRADRDSVTITPATGWLAKISKYLQQRGYVGWFGISKRGWTGITRIVRVRIREIIMGPVKR